jgi:hypothetical protein
MRTMTVVMAHAFGKHGLEVALPEDKKSVQTFASYSTREAFGHGISIGCPNRRPDDCDAIGGQNAIEADDAGVLDRPTGDWLRRHPGNRDAACLRVDEEQVTKTPE